MRAELIMIGTELLLGEIIDTNAVFLAEALADCGVDLFYKSTVGDNPSRVKEVLELALKRSDVVLISGGLGPTDDDLTREVIATSAGVELIEDSEALASIEDWFQHRLKSGELMPERNKKQALFPKGSQILSNSVGTAPGFWLELRGKTIVALPGVPHELKTMFKTHIRPRLQKMNTDQVLVVRNLQFVGIGESRLEEILQDLIIKQTNPTMALYASGGIIRLRLAAKAMTDKDALDLITPLAEEVSRRTKEFLYSSHGELLEEAVAKELLKSGSTLALAESCTGGLVGHRITNIPGSSDFFARGYIVYSNQAKIDDLGVKEETLRKFGAVSAQTAQEMAEGLRKKAQTDYALAITGIAGPGGATKLKPVGLVYISLAYLGDTIVQEHHFKGTREQVKDRAALAALHLLWQISGNDK